MTMIRSRPARRRVRVGRAARGAGRGAVRSGAVCAALIAGLLAAGLAYAAAGPAPPLPPPKEAAPADPNADEPLPGADRELLPAIPAPALGFNPKTATDAATIDQGKGMYRDYCQKCHGLNMVSSGGGVFDLRTFPPQDKARFFSSVTNGKRAMPAWGGVLKAQDIDTIWAYVASYKAQ